MFQNGLIGKIPCTSVWWVVQIDQQTRGYVHASQALYVRRSTLMTSLSGVTIRVGLRCHIIRGILSVSTRRDLKRDTRMQRR